MIMIDEVEKLKQDLDAVLEALLSMAEQYLKHGQLESGLPLYDHMCMSAGEECLEVLEIHKKITFEQNYRG